MGDLGSLLSSIFTGAIGANQLFGGGPSSVNGSAAAGASAASPFQSQFGQYQPQLQQGVTNQQQNLVNAQDVSGSIIAALLGQNNGSTMNSLSQMFQGGTPQLSSAVTGSPSNLAQQITQLSSNYMDNPAIQAQYKLGLDSAQRGLAAQGLMGSGQEMKELSDYGQQFASQAYQQQFQNLLAGNQQQFNQGLATTQEQAALQGQQFGQGATLSQLLSGNLSSAGSLQNGVNNSLISGQQGLLQQLLAASGATTGSPATAGGILSGQFANSEQAAANLGSGVSGALQRLLGGGQGNGILGLGQSGGSSGLNNVGSILKNLLGGNSSLGGSAIGSFLGGSAGDSLLSSLLSDSSMGALADSAGISGIFGSAGVAPAITNSADALGSFASLLGFDGGATGAAAAGGAAAEAGAAAGVAGGEGAAALGAGLGALGFAGPIGLFGLGMMLATSGGTTAADEVGSLRNIMSGGLQQLKAAAAPGGFGLSPGFGTGSYIGPVPWGQNNGNPYDTTGDNMSWDQFASSFANRTNVITPYTPQDWQTIHQYYDWSIANKDELMSSLAAASANSQGTEGG